MMWLRNCCLHRAYWSTSEGWCNGSNLMRTAPMCSNMCTCEILQMHKCVYNARVVCKVLAVWCQWQSCVFWCWCRGQEPRGSIRDNCKAKQLKVTALIAPDRNHTEAVSIVTAAENKTTSLYWSVILTTVTVWWRLAALFWSGSEVIRECQR